MTVPEDRQWPFLTIRLVTTNTLLVISFFLLAASLQVSARGFAQDRVTITVKQASLETILELIHKQTGYSYVFSDQLIGDLPKIDLSVRDATVQQVLDKCFKDLPYGYEIIKKMIVIKKKVAQAEGGLTSNGDLGPGPGKTVRVEGTVYNEAGEPLSGANIIIKETSKGTITNAKGVFNLGEIPANSTLSISFIGYASEQIKVTEAGSIKVYLKVAKSELDKAVVQAYGTTTQRLATGNIGTVTAEDIAKQPIINPLQALQGQVAGVEVTQTSGFASAPIKVEIRGRSTLNPGATSDPLYIIDGVPLTVLDVAGTASYTTGSPGFIQTGLIGPENGQSPFFSIDPANIESITVLKDADATAIYGSRGADGVILITTKKGKPGKTHFEMNVYQGTQMVPRYYNMLNTPQYLAMRREALANDGLPVDINNAPDLVAWDTTRHTNWQKVLWGGIGRLTNAEANISGGDVRTTFRIAGGYTRQSDVETVSGSNQRGNLSVNLHHSSQNQRLVLNFNSSYSYSYINEIYLSGAGTLPPDAPPIYDKNGQLNYAGWGNIINYPFGNLMTPYSANTEFFTTNLDLSFELLKGLNLRSNVGYNNAATKQTNFTTIASQNPATNPYGTSQFGYNTLHNLIFEPQISYTRFLGKGKLDALLGGSMQSNSTEGLFVRGNGYTSDELIGSITAAPTQFDADYYGQYKYAAVFSRLNYNIDDKYIINLNGRRDGSSRFGPGRQYGNFGSIGAAWIFSEEGWMKRHFSLLSFGKLRGSYGITGNDKIGDYQFLSLWTPTASYLYNGIRPVSPVGPSDSLLQWEVNHKLEISLDLAFFKDRLSIEASWYRNRCNNQLTNFPTPVFTGFGSVTANSPADVQNTGFEFVANSKNIDGKHFTWQTRFNIGINRNKLLAYPNLAQSPFASYFVIGKPLNNLFLLHRTGVDPQTGLYTFEDRNHDGQITVDFSHPGTADDDRYFYDLTTHYSGGLTNTFTYRNLSLSIFLYFIRKKGINALSNLGTPGGPSNEPTSILHHWQKPGDISTTAKFTTQPYNISYSDFTSFSDAIYGDASFIRLQNVSLTYRLPMKPSATEIKVFVKCENLFLLTKYNGIDPEVQSFGGLPLLRTVTLGVSCNL